MSLLDIKTVICVKIQNEYPMCLQFHSSCHFNFGKPVIHNPEFKVAVYINRNTNSEKIKEKVLVHNSNPHITFGIPILTLFSVFVCLTILDYWENFIRFLI